MILIKINFSAFYLQFPCIILFENVIWSPEVFLNKFGSTLLMKIRGANDKMSTANMQRIQQQWLQAKCQRLSKDAQIYAVQVCSMFEFFVCFRINIKNFF